MEDPRELLSSINAAIDLLTIKKSVIETYQWILHLNPEKATSTTFKKLTLKRCKEMWKDELKSHAKEALGLDESEKSNDSAQEEEVALKEPEPEQSSSSGIARPLLVSKTTITIAPPSPNSSTSEEEIPFPPLVSTKEMKRKLQQDETHPAPSSSGKKRKLSESDKHSESKKKIKTNKGTPISRSRPTPSPKLVVEVKKPVIQKREDRPKWKCLVQKSSGPCDFISENDKVYRHLGATTLENHDVPKEQRRSLMAPINLLGDIIPKNPNRKYHGPKN